MYHALCCFFQNVSVEIEDEVLYFEGLGTGAQGRRVYKFSLAYYLPVLPKVSSSVR